MPRKLLPRLPKRAPARACVALARGSGALHLLALRHLARCRGDGLAALLGSTDRAAADVVGDLEREAGLPATGPGGELSPHRVIAFTTSALVGPADRFPAHYRFVGPSISDRPEAATFPWAQLGPRPRVLVTMGTVNVDVSTRFYATTIAALGSDQIAAMESADLAALTTAQLRAIDALECCEREWADYKARRANAVTKLLVRPPIPRGVYMWGGVGRGKSFLMDCFFQSVPLTRKTRLHFHEFMREVHRELQDLKGTVNPLEELGVRMARRYRLICFDEFHVADVTDAMILHRLLQSLFDNRVSIVTTSNFHPDGLYPNGLHRDRI